MEARAMARYVRVTPRIRSTTRRAFRGVTRTYRAFALASIAVSLSLAS